MHYWVDGYNLLFRTSAARHYELFKEQREDFIQHLVNKIRVARLSASLVFDSHYQPGSGHIRSLLNVNIHFTNEGQTADDYILEQISCSKIPKHHTVVTSDEGLAWHARLREAHSQSVKEFLNLLSRKAAKKAQSKINMSMPKTIVKRLTLEERYHTIFEERLKQEPKPSANPLPKGRDKPKKSANQEVSKSDYLRWLEMFEGRGDPENSTENGA